MENSKSRYGKLLSPYRIKNVTFRNRIIVGAHVMTQLQDFLPRPTKAYADHYVEFAKGGAGCVVVAGPSAFKKLDVENIDVDGETGFYNIYGKEYMRSVAEMVDRIHSYGAKASLMHDFHVPYGYTCSPGITLLPLQNEPMSKGEMTPEIMDKVADAFADAAMQAVILGFDLFQIHMSSGGLLMQFLSRATNKRTDEYNGNMENRARFPLMVVDRIREKVGDRILLQVKLCCNEGVKDGITIDEAIEFLKLLEGKVDLVHLAGGTHWDPSAMTTATVTTYDDVNPYETYAKKIKAAGITIPLELTGGLQDPDVMEAALEDGTAEFVNSVRGLIADPEMPNKTYHGEAENIRPCIRCMHCMNGIAGIGFDCSVNPRIGRQHLAEDISMAKPGEKLAVVGGGPAGMLAAITAEKRGYQVVLYEASDHLGGNTDYKDTPIKKPFNKYIQYLIRNVNDSDIELHLSEPVTRELLDQKDYQRVLLAVGAEQLTPPIPGAAEYGTLVRDFYAKKMKVEGHAVIIGGGISGCETAILLARQGCTVTLLEGADKLGPNAKRHELQGLGSFMFVQAHLDALSDQVTVITSALCKKIEKDSVTYEHNGEEKQIKNVNCVILSTGLVSRTEEVMSLWREGTMTMAIGDCESVGDVEHATRTAYDAAINI